MEKALGTRLIVCCLEVLPVRPFIIFVYCRMHSLILGLSVGNSKKKKAKKKKRKWKRSLELGGLVHAEPGNDKDMVKRKREQRKKDDKTLTVLQSKLTMF